MESLRDIFQKGQTHAVFPDLNIKPYEVTIDSKQIEEFSLYDIAEIILEVEENAKETSCASCQ